MRQALILVHGYPGVGKTTLQHKLATDLGLPSIGKDQIKEFLADTMASTWHADDSAARSVALGKVSTMAMYAIADAMLASKASMIMENAYYAEFAREDIANLLQKYPVACMEVYCVADEAVRQQRFEGRVSNGTRHAVHHDNLPRDMAMLYPPLDVSHRITYDTTRSDTGAYDNLLTDIRTWMEAARND